MFSRYAHSVNKSQTALSMDFREVGYFEDKLTHIRLKCVRSAH